MLILHAIIHFKFVNVEVILGGNVNPETTPKKSELVTVYSLSGFLTYGTTKLRRSIIISPKTARPGHMWLIIG